MFGDRFAKGTSDQFYFQIAPNYLTVKSSVAVRALKTKNVSYKLKLLKETQKTDQMRNPIPGKPINGKIPFQKVQLNFYIPTNRNIQYTLTLLEIPEGSETSTEIGTYTILSGEYIDEFQAHKTRQFTQNVDLGKDFSLNFDLFINNTRIALEKFIKETRDQRKQESRNNLANTSGNKQIPKINKPRSQVNSQSSRGEIIPGQNRFMSPSRRIVRKSGNDSKKLLMRSNSPSRSQRSGGSQTSSQKNRDLKFSKGRDGGMSPRRNTPSLAQQEPVKIDRRKQEQEKKRKILQENAKATKELEKKRAEQAQRREQQKQAAEERKKKIAEQKQAAEREAKRRQQEEKRKAERVARQEERKKQLQKNRQLNKAKQQQKVRQNLERSRQSSNKGNLASSQRSNPKAPVLVPNKLNQDPSDILQSTKVPARQSSTRNQKFQIKRTDSVMEGSMKKSIKLEKKQQPSIQNTLAYAAFMGISIVLILFAMTPSSKV